MRQRLCREIVCNSGNNQRWKSSYADLSRKHPKTIGDVRKRHIFRSKYLCSILIGRLIRKRVSFGQERSSLVV